jgi:hypothetical protein
LADASLASHILLCERGAPRALSLESNEVSKAAQDPSPPPLWQRVLSLRQIPFYSYFILHPTACASEWKCNRTLSLPAEQTQIDVWVGG